MIPVPTPLWTRDEAVAATGGQAAGENRPTVRRCAAKGHAGGSLQLLAVIQVIGAVGQRSRGDLHGVADADGKLFVGGVHAVAELNGEGECAGSGWCAIDFAG